MSLDFSGYNNLVGISNISKGIKGLGEGIGGLLGWADKSMRDDKGFFQGGKYGRRFGRIQDALGITQDALNYQDKSRLGGG